MKVKVGDNVLVTTGKYKGKTGKVMRVYKKQNRLTVEKVNMRTKHVKKNAGRAGEKVTYEAPFDVSNVKVIDPSTNKATRVGYKMVKGKKVRIGKKSGEGLDQAVTKKAKK